MTFHVVVGAGAVGMATAARLAEAGERVRQVTRSGSGHEHPLIERVAADASDADALTKLVDGAETLVQVSAPAYDRWVQEFPALASGLLTAAERTGAGYVMLGNVYGYGPADGPFRPDQPMRPVSAKGRVRARIWEEALASDARVTEVRASDFLGQGALSVFTLLAEQQIRAGQPVRIPGGLDVPHAWSVVDDVAATLIAAARSPQSWGRAWHVPSTVLTVRELARLVARLAAAPEPVLAEMTVGELRSGGPIFAEVEEMLYLDEQPLVLDASDTERLLGVRATPLERVFRR